jgi:hypothetical protein
MRLIIDAMAVAGFALSASMTAALVITYTQFDSMKQKAIENMTGQITGAVTDQFTKQLDGKFDGMIEGMPTQTGPAVPTFKP